MSENALPKADVAAIRSVIESTFSVLEAGDFTAWLSLWTEDGRIMPPNQPVVEGHDAMRAFIESWPKVQEITISDLRIDGRQDLAVATSGLSMSLHSPELGDFEDTAKQMIMLRKQPDGRWLFAEVILNSDLPA